jgi:hypothetical protein
MAGPTLGLTDEEQALIKSIGAFARGFYELTPLHPADADEMAFHVHALARIVAMRAAHRAHPELIPNRSGTAI